MSHRTSGPHPCARTIALAAVIALIAAASIATADVTVKQKTVTSGLAGFGNGSTVSTLVIAGDRSRSDEESTYSGRFKALAGGGKPRKSGVITRLDQELIWTLDDEKKQYVEMTFAEMRQMMEQGKAEMEAEDAEQQKPQDADMEFKVDVKHTGKKETVNGFPAEQVIITLTGASTDQQTGNQGSMTMTLDQWMSEAVPGTAEVQAYYRQFAEKLGIDPQMRSMGGMAMAMYGNAIRKLADEMKDLKGYPVRSTMTIETGAKLSPEQQAEMEKAKAEQAKAQAEESKKQEAAEDAEATAEAGSSVKQGKLGSALGGMLGRKLGKAAGKKAEEKAGAAAGPSGPGSGPAFTATTEVLSVTSGAASVGFDVPAGYKKIERSKK